MGIAIPVKTVFILRWSPGVMSTWSWSRTTRPTTDKIDLFCEHATMYPDLHEDDSNLHGRGVTISREIPLFLKRRHAAHVDDTESLKNWERKLRSLLRTDKYAVGICRVTSQSDTLRFLILRWCFLCRKIRCHSKNPNGFQNKFGRVRVTIKVFNPVTQNALPYIKCRMQRIGCNQSMRQLSFGTPQHTLSDAGKCKLWVLWSCNVGV